MLLKVSEWEISIFWFKCCVIFFCSSVATAVSFSHNAGKYDKDEEADDEIQGKTTRLS